MPEPRPRSRLRRIGDLLPWLLPVLAFIGVMVYTLMLQHWIPDGVFYSGDGGLKALMTRQFARGEMRADLDLPAEPWVQQLWDEGLYPLKPPFAYIIDGHWYTQYSFCFPLTTAPFYSMLGSRGLYLLPLVATWALAIGLIAASRALGLGALASTGVMVSGLLAAPVSFYSGTYWEHNLAVFLAFVGLSPLLRPVPPSGGRLLVAGAVLGFAAWFREELLCLIGVLMLLTMFWALIGRKRELWGPGGWIRYFGAAMVLVLISFGLNTVIYGHPLGVHSFSVVQQPFSLMGRLENAWTLMVRLGGLLVESVPMVGFLVMTLALMISRDRFRQGPQEILLCLICIIFFAVLPLVLPDVKLDGDGGKQVGPRFLLPMFPLVALCTGLAMSRLFQLRRDGVRWVFLGIYLGLFSYGLYKNAYAGALHLREDYELRIQPAVTYLRSIPDENIAVHFQHMAQEMLFALPEKHFFLTDDDQDFQALAKALQARGEDEFLYLRYYTYPPPDPVPVVLGTSRHMINFTDTGGHGIYTFYEGWLDAEPQ